MKPAKLSPISSLSLSTPPSLPPPLPRIYNPLRAMQRSPLLPPIQRKTKKQIRIWYTPTRSTLSSIHRIMQRAKDISTVQIQNFENRQGYNSIVLQGEPNDIRIVLGTDEPMLEKVNEETMIKLRRSTIDNTFENIPIPRAKQTIRRKHEPSLLKKVLVQSFQTAQQSNRSRRFRNSTLLPKTLDFKNKTIQ